MTDKQTERLLDDQWAIDYSCSKSMRYHAYRRSFWQNCDYWAKVITIISGFAVVVAVVGEDYWYSKVFGFVVAVFATLDVVLGFSERQRLHDKLYREFCRLQLDIVGQLHPTEQNIADWKSRRLEIEMEEPGVLDLLERRCAGEESRARGVPLTESQKLTTFQLLRSQFSLFPGVSEPAKRPG
jgi:hypothetical protein